MSLTFEQMAEAHKRYEKMDERLKKLIGFNPTTSNHYGCIQLYNHEIDMRTTDEEIMKLRADYLKWRDKVINLISECGFTTDNEDFNDQFNDMFSVSGMFGTLYFLGIPINIHTEPDDTYRERIELCLIRRGLISPRNIYKNQKGEG